MKKWIVGLACLGMLAMNSVGGLIISQYYEGASYNKWIEIYNPGPGSVDLDAGAYSVGRWGNANREGWKTSVAPDDTVALTGSLAEGATILLRHNSAVLPSYAVAQITNSGVCNFNGDDSVVMYTGTFDFANVVDAFGLTGNTAANKSYVRTNSVTSGVNTDFNAADWIEYTNTEVDDAVADTNERLGYHSTGAATFSVSFDLGDDFIVDEGVSEVLTATAANGTEPYTYSWSSDLGGTYYTTASNTFTILATAPTGTFTATVEASDASPATVTNSINFSVQAPAPKYAITITTPTNGAVTTTPTTEAEAGQTVTINATPNGGYAVDTTTVLDSTGGVVSVSGGEFTMPALAVTVTVTFQVHVGSVLYISEVADPGDVYQGRFVELYNSSGSSIDLAAGTWTLVKQVNGATMYDVALTGTVAAGSTYVVAGYTNFPDLYPSAPAGTPDQTSGTISGNGDDGYFLYSGGDEVSGAMEDAYGVLNEDGSGKPWEYENARAVRETSVTSGNPTWTASEWAITDPADVADMTPGVYPDGPVVFSVSFDQTEGFTVDEGSSQAVTATAANGVEPYTYVWSSPLAASNYTAVSNVFTILANVSTGAYSATVEASDASPATVTNTINFTVVPPPVKYAITITTPTNGAVTTTPPTEAAESETVTVNAVASNGYRTATINVSGIGDLAGTTFTMPAGPVTVTVTFEVYVAPDALVDFEDYTGSYASNDYVAAGVTWMMTNAYAGSTADDRKFDTKAGRFQHDRPGVGNPAMMRSSAFAQPINKINFWYANYGVNTGGMFKVQVSDDGTTWQDVGLEYAPDSTILVEGIIDVIPANMTYVQIITTAGDPGRVNIDNIGFFFGAATYGVSVDKSNGYVIDEGDVSVVTATAANGTAPYSYAWTSTLGGTYWSTNANVFTVLATAPTGSYSTTVIATDSDTPALVATNILTFSVVTPGVSNSITITPPVNGSVTTTPAGGAYSGDTVTVNATPDGGFQVDSITVVDAATNPVAVVGTTFTMPASAVTVNVLFSLIPTGAEVVIVGSLTGDVNEVLALAITVTNGTAADWAITLLDPDNQNVWLYDPPPAFSFTPTKVGDYSLTATAKDGADQPIASTNITLTITTPSVDPDIPPITFVPGTGFTFLIPSGYILTRVEGAVTTLSGDAYNWLELTEGAGNDYTLVGTTVTVLDGATLPSGYGRMIRLVVTAD